MLKLAAISIIPASFADSVQKVALQFRDFRRKIDPRDEAFSGLITQFQKFFEMFNIELLKFSEKEPENKKVKRLLQKSRKAHKLLFSIENFYRKSSRYSRALASLRDLKRTVLSAGPEDRAVIAVYEKVEVILAPIESEIRTKAESIEGVIKDLGDAGRQIHSELITNNEYKNAWVQSRIMELKRPEIHRIEFSPGLMRVTEEIKANRKTMEAYVRILKFISVLEGILEHKVTKAEDWSVALTMLPRPDTSPVTNAYIWKALPIKPGTTLKEMYNMTDEFEGRLVIQQSIQRIINKKDEIDEAIENLKEQNESLMASETQVKSEIWQEKVQSKYEYFLATIQKYINNAISALTARAQIMDPKQIKVYLDDIEKIMEEMVGETFAM